VIQIMDWKILNSSVVIQKPLSLKLKVGFGKL
jgi:hypothetical protein